MSSWDALTGPPSNISLVLALSKYLGDIAWTVRVHKLSCYSVNVLEVSFGSIDPFGAEASEVYDQACIWARDEGKRVKGILLCSPNNPLGWFNLSVSVAAKANTILE